MLNRRLRHIEDLSQQLCRNAFTASNDNDLFSGQLRKVLIFSARRMQKAEPISVQHVFASRYVLQVIDVIIRWLSVDVVDFFSVRAWADKCRCHEAVDFALNVFPLASKIDRQMTALTSRWAKDLSYERRLACPTSPDAPKARDFIPAFAANDFSPFFLHG
jgi:hypothetical protein